MTVVRPTKREKKEEKELQPIDGLISEVGLEEELKTAYLGYAMSVIVSRALPDIRDGLKPVHRRILYTMHEMGVSSQKAHKKSARIAGDVTGKYHPHGTTAVYDAIVRMAQDFSLRYPLIEGQGNFGSIDGDPPAAYRYTAARLSPIAQAMLTDLEKATVDFSANYDGTEEEPSLLPAAFPNLLVNGSSGIAVGMATNIPPHNLTEVLDACLALLREPSLPVERLLDYIPGPDFPTGGIIHGAQGIYEAYRTGKGRLIVRGVAKIVESEGSTTQIIIDELPYQVNKARLVESIAGLIKEKKIESISGLRDESDGEGMRIVIDVKRSACPNVLLNQLYQLTNLQTSFCVNMVALSGGRPIRSNLKQILEGFLLHRRTIVMRRSRHDRDKALARLNLLMGFMVIWHNLDRCIGLIRTAASSSEAKNRLLFEQWPVKGLAIEQLAHSQEQFDQTYRLNEVQAQAVLEMRLHRLTTLEQGKILEEHRELRQLVETLQHILCDAKALEKVIESELQAMKGYGDPRRTRIEQASAFSEEDFVPNETVIVTLSQKGYIKYQHASDYEAQHRGGRGKLSTSLRAEDAVHACLVANTHDNLLCFSSRGRLYWLKVYQLPLASRASRGRPIVNLLPLAEDEQITAILSLSKGADYQFVFFVTSHGTVKKTPLSDLQSTRSSGLIAIKLLEDEKLVAAEFTTGNCEIMLFSAMGKVVRFPEKQVRSMGRNATGVRGIQLTAGDRVVSLVIPQNNAEILTVTENGFGKRTPIDQYPAKSRATQGVISIKVTERNGRVVSALQTNDQAEVLLLTDQGVLLRVPVQEISCIGRNTQGVTLVRLDSMDHVGTVQLLVEPEVLSRVVDDTAV